MRAGDGAGGADDGWLELAECGLVAPGVLRAAGLEAVELLSVTAHDDLPPDGRHRLGTTPGQVNALVRLVLRPPAHTLTAAEANALRNTVYRALHRGPHLELT